MPPFALASSASVAVRLLRRRLGWEAVDTGSRAATRHRLHTRGSTGAPLGAPCRSQHQQNSAPIAASVEMVDGEPSSAAVEEAEAEGVAGYVLARGTQASEYREDSKQLLSSSPAGAYTTMRTVGVNAIFELSFHISRLAQSCRLMMEETGVTDIHDGHACLVDPTALRPLVLDSVRAAFQKYHEVHPSYQGELRPTVLITWTEDRSYEILTHVGPLPPRPQHPIMVQISGAPRENAAAKNSEWVRARKELEENAPPGCNEVLLMAEDGSVVEGLSSNFFAVKDGTLYTAQEGVLLGTVRDMVLKVATREGIPIVLEPPNIADLESWSGACVTSTSRLMLCIDEIAVENQDARKVFTGDSVLAQLEKLVQQEIDTFSEAY